MVANQCVASSKVDKGTLSKQEFVLQVIKALEEREHKSTPTARLSLAEGAFEKLQFDFPAVTTDELQALIHHFRECVQAKSGWFPYQFTARFASNVLAGAKCIAEKRTSADQQSPSLLQEPFQHIATFIYFQYMKLVLSLPPPQAWALLARYVTDDEPAVSENGVASAVANPETCTATPQVATDDIIAAELDDDDCQYEDMDFPSTSAASAHPISSSDEISQPYSPTLLCRKLIHLSSQLEYSHVCLPSVWQATHAEESVLETLRVLGVHSQAAELRPVTQTYLAVVTEHILACPDATPLLTRVSDALGLASTLAVPRRRRHGHSPLLAAEMDCMLNMTTSLVVRVTSARGRVQLWKQVQELLPMIDHCMEQVAGIANAEASQEGLDVLLMVADLLAFYVSEAPGGASVGASLQDSGVLRSLAILFGRYGASPATESIRKAALLAAAGSPAVCSWLLAVPSTVQALGSPAFCTAGLAEAHGAVWQMLGQTGNSPLVLEIMGRGFEAAHVDRKVQLLQLLLAAQRAANGRQLWNNELAAVLRQQLHAMTAQLHAMTTRVPSNDGNAPDQNGAANGHNSNGHVSRDLMELQGNGQLRGEGATIAADGNGSVGTVAGTAARHSESSEEDEEEDAKEHAARAPAVRTPQRNIRVCVRLMKQLVVQGGKSE